MGRTRLGEMLVQEGRLDAVQLQSAVVHQSRWGGRIGQTLVNMGLVSERAVMQALARQLGVRFVEIGGRTVPPAVLHLVPERLIRRRRVLPVAMVTGRGPLVLALSDPADLALLDEIAFATGLGVEPVLAAPGDIERAIARHLDGAPPDSSREIELPDEDPGPMRLMHWKQ